MLSEGVNEGLIRLKEHGPNKGLMTIYGEIRDLRPRQNPDSRG